MAASHRRRHVAARSADPSSPTPSGEPPPPPPAAGGPPPNWWDRINKRNVQGPEPPRPPPEPQGWEEWGMQRMGRDGYLLWEVYKRDERQRVWDNMRRIARERYSRGEMPGWFRPEWLDLEEAPTNAWWRQQGLSVYQLPDWGSGGGGGGGGGSGGGGGGGGGGWWRPDDPYWPMRDWGDHPMRWWTWAWAALLAAGGVRGVLTHASAEAAYVGMGASALLALCAAAMSDMRSFGVLGVKAAWGTCCLLALKDGAWGWQHKRAREQLDGSRAGPGACGWAAAGMCVLYMWTGMAGMDQYALPMNPGGAFKLEDVAQRHKVWARWGYGDLSMQA